MDFSIFLTFLSGYISYVEALRCYQCVGTHPGCGDPFNFWWNWSVDCPASNDKCVKLMERKGPDVLITRDCLSAFKGRRRDIPADQYEGCRPASKDIQLAQFTFNNIDELDIHRDYYDDVTWCFCDFDERCNSGWGLQPIPFRWLFFLVLLATYCSSHAH